MGIKKFCLLGLFGLSGCSANNGYLELPFKNPDNVIKITKDTVLNKDYKGTSFKVYNGATLFVGDFTLDGRTSDNTGSFAIVELIDGSHLVGGNLQYGRGGAVIRQSLPRNWKKTLTELPQYKRVSYIESIRSKLNGCSTITDTSFTQNRNHIYITSLTPCSVITNVNIHYGRLGIYHDAYSQYSFVSSSLFNSIGHKYFSSKRTGGLFEYKSSRESVAIDGSSYNNYSDNIFRDGAKNAINLYVNCGEKGADGIAMPREEPALSNVITGNSFENYNTAIYNGSRHPNRLTYPCRSDDHGDRVINTSIGQNTFTNVTNNIKGYDFIN